MLASPAAPMLQADDFSCQLQLRSFPSCNCQVRASWCFRERQHQRGLNGKAVCDWQCFQISFNQFWNPVRYWHPRTLVLEVHQSVHMLPWEKTSDSVPIQKGKFIREGSSPRAVHPQPHHSLSAREIIFNTNSRSCSAPVSFPSPTLETYVQFFF